MTEPDNKKKIEKSKEWTKRAPLRPDEQKAQAVDLYADGFNFVQIAKMTGVPRGTLQKWCYANKPCDWAQMRTDRMMKKLKIQEDASLESYEKTQVRHQRLLKNIQHRLTNRVLQAKDEDIPISTALNGVQEMIDKERENFAKLEDLLTMKAGKTSALLVGAQAGDGKASVMAFLTDSFNAIHNGPPKPEATETIKQVDATVVDTVEKDGTGSSNPGQGS